MESYKPAVVGQCKGALDEVSILGKELNRLLLAHGGELILDTEFSVILSGSIEQLLEIALVLVEHEAELLLGGGLLPNGNALKSNLGCFEKFECFLARAALFVNVDFEDHDVGFIKLRTFLILRRTVSLPRIAMRW